MSSGLPPAAERLESIKAALVSGLVSGIVALGVLVGQRVVVAGWVAGGLSLRSGLGAVTAGVGLVVAGVSGGLFGLTYRYAVRQDANPQLKQGVVGAFALVRGLAQVDGSSALAQRGWPYGIAVGESMVMFGLAALALEVALNRHWIRPLP